MSVHSAQLKQPARHPEVLLKTALVVKVAAAGTGGQA